MTKDAEKEDVREKSEDHLWDSSFFVTNSVTIVSYVKVTGELEMIFLLRTYLYSCFSYVRICSMFMDHRV